MKYKIFRKKETTNKINKNRRFYKNKMEVYPHLYVIDYESLEESNIIKNRKINVIVHFSKNKRFLNIDKIEEIRIPVEIEHEPFDIEEVNLNLFSYFWDTTDYVYQKITDFKNVLIIGLPYRQEVDSFIVAFYIKYGKVNPKYGIYYLKTKKRNIFYPECMYNMALEKFYHQCNKNQI